MGSEASEIWVLGLAIDAFSGKMSYSRRFGERNLLSHLLVT
jgi:hypothetical protein